MKISVIVTTFERAHYIAACIDGVLAQSRPPDEVIVVDDGSTDQTPSVLATYGDHIRVISIPHAGNVIALNSGLAAATGDLLAFCDDDDVYLPEKLALQLAVITAQPQLDAVFGHMRQFVCPRASAAAHARFRPDLEVMPSRNLSVMLARRTLFERVGRLNIALPAGAPLEWMTRAEHAGLCAQMLAETVYLRRIHDGNIGVVNGAAQRAAYLVAVQARLAHRRAKQKAGA